MKYNVLVIVYPKIGGCQFYRQVHAHELFASYKQFHVRMLPHLGLINEDELKKFHMVLFHKNYVQPEQLKKLRQSGLKTMVDFDDYWQLPYNHKSHKEYLKNNQTAKFKEILTYTDYVSVTTGLLANEVKKYNPNVFVFPNCLNPDNVYVKFLTIPSEKIRFGYIGGSCHLPDMELLRGINNALNHTGLNYQLNLFGYRSDNEYFDYARLWTNDGKYTNNITLYPPLGVPEYLSFYSLLDVALIPLINNKFNNLKSELKLIEAGMFKKAVIVSDVMPYKPFLKDKVNCLIVRKKTDWLKKMKYALKNPSIITELGNNLFTDVQKHFNIQGISAYRADAYQKIIDHD